MVSEARHQAAVIQWSQQPEIRSRWPELKLLYHIKNETKEGARQIAVDKALGVKKGVPDLHLPVARGSYHSLYIEMKKENGKATPEQNWWGEQLLAQGNRCEVCRGWKEAVRVLEWYLSLSGPQ